MASLKYTIDKKRSRKYTYIVIQQDGTILVKTNFLTSKQTIEHFIEQKTDWIKDKQKKIFQALKDEEKKVYFLGKLYDKQALQLDNIDQFYKTKAIEIIPPLVEKWSSEMKLYPTHISFRKNKSRWGSCSIQNRLSFNTQLIKTPLEFIEYVVIHELAHIQHKNHSKSFWNLVQKHLPDFKQRKNIVKNQHFIL